MTEKVTALVLRVVEFSETSCVVTLFTREFGKLHGLAKGGRRLKGPFESALDLLALCRIVLLRKSSESLDLLTEAKLERRFRAAGRDLSSLYAGYYVAELLNELTDSADPHPDLFDEACQTLLALAQGNGSVASVVLRFELAALRTLGHLPSLAACVECGKPVAPGVEAGEAVTIHGPAVGEGRIVGEGPGTGRERSGEGRVAFGVLAGGVLCGRCRPGKKHVVSINAATLRVLDRFADPADEAWRRMSIERSTRGELRGVVNQYLCHLLGRKPRMHGYLGALSS